MTRAARETRRCERCDKRFTERVRYLRGQKRHGVNAGRFCSRACWRAALREKKKPATRECSKCGKTLPFDREHFEVRKRTIFGLGSVCKPCNAQLAKAGNKRARDKLRLQILTHYGNGVARCVCCGEDLLEFLVLDHINGGGGTERKKYPGYLWIRLRKLGFPPGYRTLCSNCNHSYGRYGYCPHQKKDS